MTIQFAPEAIEHWPIERLRPYARNAKTHGSDQVAKIAASMAEFGWTVPVLVSAEGEVIAGHGRIMAAGKLGLPEVPVIILDHLTEAQRRAYRIADNKLTELGGWDDALLAQELHALNGDGFDLSLTGLDEAELDRLMGELADEAGGAVGEDEVPEPPVDPVTRPGDLWLLGRHRLLCGDSTSATDVERLLGGAVPHLMITDPPYGVEYDPEWRNEAGVSATSRTGKVANDHRADWREAWALFPGDVAYVWHAGVHASTVADSLAASGFSIRSQIIWAKPRLVLSRGHYHWHHEPCWYAVRDGATGHWQGARDQTTVWMIGNGDEGEDGATVHGTQKPVECMRRPILNHSASGSSVYEPFSGSGTTIIAAETTGRSCFAMELDPPLLRCGCRAVGAVHRAQGRSALQSWQNWFRSRRLRNRSTSGGTTIGKMGDGYGSEFHLLQYLGRSRDHLNHAVKAATGAEDVEWLKGPPDASKPSGRGEWKGLGFLANDGRLQEAWRKVWPARGNPPNWDAVGKVLIGGNWEWLLVEAKANEQELLSSCSASERGGRGLIEETLSRTKQALGVAEERDWLNGYYQYANRLAVLSFLHEQHIPAHLLFVYFTGDKGDARRTCPADEKAWERALAKQSEDLGLPADHPLHSRVHRIFLKVNAVLASQTASPA